MSLTRDPIIVKVMAETKRTDKQTALETSFPDVLRDMSRARTEDGESIPLQDLKKDGSLTINDGEYFVALPDDFIFQYAEPELLYDTDKGRILLKRSINQLNYLYPNRANDTTQKARPSYYSLEKNRFDFASKSDATYSIKLPYTCLHPIVSTNAIAILFGDRFESVIKDLLKAKLFEILDDFDKMEHYESRGIGKLRSLAITDKRNSDAVTITEYNDV